MISAKDATTIVVNTWGIDKTIKTVMLGLASFAVTVGVCAVAIPNSKGETIIFTEKENNNEN